MAKFGIGITTYRDKKKENWNIPVYMDTKRGNYFIASKKVNRFVRDSIDWKGVSGYKGYPALGTYEGGQEPAAHVYFETKKPSIINSIEVELRGFKEMANQDSILLYKFVKSGGVPVLEIPIKPGQPIRQIQEVISKATDGKIGGYLTYIYSLHRLVIVNVKEFDDLTPAEFRKFVPAVKKAVKPYGGKIIMKQARVTVI